MRLNRTLIGLATTAAVMVCAAPALADVSWDRTWGKDVVVSGTNVNYEVCTEALDCQFGNGGNLGGEFQTVSSATQSYFARAPLVKKKRR